MSLNRRSPINRKTRLKSGNAQLRRKKTPQQRRRELEANAPGRGVTPEDRRAILERDGHKCLRCKRTWGLVIDHIRALSCRGRNDPDNLQTLCWACNLAKGLQTIDYRRGPESPDGEQADV